VPFGNKLNEFRLYIPLIIIMYISGTFLVILSAPLILFLDGMYGDTLKYRGISHLIFLYILFFKSIDANFLVIIVFLGFFAGIFIQSLQVVFWNDLVPFINRKIPFLINIVRKITPNQTIIAHSEKDYPKPATYEYAKFQFFIYEHPFIKQYIEWEWFLELVYGYILFVLLFYLGLFAIYVIVSLSISFDIILFFEFLVFFIFLNILIIIIFRTMQIHRAASMWARTVAYKSFKENKKVK